MGCCGYPVEGENDNSNNNNNNPNQENKESLEARKNGCCDGVYVEDKTAANNNNQNDDIKIVQEHEENIGNDIIIKNQSLYRAKTNAAEFGLEDYKNKIIDFHNKLRQEHKSPKIKENEELNDMASAYVESLINNKNVNNHLNQYNGQIVGEIIIISKSSKLEDILKKISDEKKDYDFKSKKFSIKSSHFTQVIWKGTSDIGFGFYTDKDSKIHYIVLLYYPAGNILGDFSENIYE